MFSGCVERTISINSEPAGALVYLNDVEIGRTPTTVPFTFYGTYSVRLEKEGYTTLNTSSEAKAPWWDNVGPDLFAEMGDNKVELVWEYELAPVREHSEAEILDRAKQLRSKAVRERKY